MKKESERSVYDFTIEIRKLGSLAHIYISVGYWEQITVYYLIRIVDNWDIQRHLLSVDTSTVEGTVRVIDEYLAIRTLNRPVCKAVDEGTTASQLTELQVTLAGQTDGLSTQSAMLTAESELSSRLKHWSTALRNWLLVSRTARPSNHRDWWTKLLWKDNSFPAPRVGPHLKRECTQLFEETEGVRPCSIRK